MPDFLFRSSFAKPYAEGFLKENTLLQLVFLNFEIVSLACCLREVFLPVFLPYQLPGSRMEDCFSDRTPNRNTASTTMSSNSLTYLWRSSLSEGREKTQDFV